ncbi:HlyD family efflux transporter periplasmic adaptor subunit [Ponticaulis sp.]|uniref:HlyD family secretion protein n=1 Tax=Ponticaulis sp. TaxID=2020902 RepID=UPI000B71968B|nr:HlyD family efflux transporter periplasmic adaptor subunit [Ponticaulis sp.]MAI90672.1 secretion protein HlyD [Ponticaulis sp.]OUX99179.1 MAG: hypothetical protein CBB65_09550 [Hyphomonadaceae bacterium TMED5]|tara:strand:+ start:34211 stop:35161 length:951 start_codon:yes stop_codon:yes gene_type:complete
MPLKRALLSGFLLAPALLLTSCSEPEDAGHIGYVEADWIYIASPQSGWVVSRLVNEGDLIEPGDLLFELDDETQLAALAEAESRVAQAYAEARNTETGARAPEIRQLQAQLADAEAALANAVSERDRVLPLVEQGLEPRSRGDQLITSVERAQAGVEAAEEAIASARLPARDGVQEASLAAAQAAEAARATAQIRVNDRQVFARSAGRVEEVFQDPGEFVNAGTPVLAVLPDDGLTVRFFVPQAELPQFFMGKEISVSSDGSGPVMAVISRIASDAEFTPPVIYSADERDKLVFEVEARLPAGSNLRPGLPVDVDW